MIRAAMLAAGLALAAPFASYAAEPVPSHVDFPGFAALTQEVRDVRAQRLVTLEAFWAMAADPKTLILDARSKDAYARGHIAGAVNLPFTDFTAQSLAAAIGDPDRPILIYCNNNFSNDVVPVILKSRPLALNIQTFINLYGYGYRNVYELSETVDFNEARVKWVAQADPAAGPG